MPDKTTAPRIAVSAEAIRAVCVKYHIVKLALFGSVLREDFRSDSDVDVLVEFAPGLRATLFDMGAAQVELSDLLGREVDLKTSGFLSPYFRQQVESSAQIIYERR